MTGRGEKRLAEARHEQELEQERGANMNKNRSKGRNKNLRRAPGTVTCANVRQEAILRRKRPVR